MTKDQELLLFKFFAFGAVVLYLYKASQASGGTLKGNPMIANLDADKVSRLGAQFVPEAYRNHAAKLGKMALDRILN